MFKSLMGKSATTLDDKSADLLFRAARTHNAFTAEPVTDADLKAIYDLLKWGPTSANCQPMRILFLRSPAAKARLKPALSENNSAKTMAAPVTAVIGYDMKFYEHLPKMFAHNQTAKSWFEGKPAFIESTAFRNSSLQGAYFMIAARAVGLDVGAMSGYDQAKVDAEFWPDGSVKSNFLCNLGHGDPAKVMPRNPRFNFEEVCKVL